MTAATLTRELEALVRLATDALSADMTEEVLRDIIGAREPIITRVLRAVREGDTLGDSEARLLFELRHLDGLIMKRLRDHQIHARVDDIARRSA